MDENEQNVFTPDPNTAQGFITTSMSGVSIMENMENIDFNTPCYNPYASSRPIQRVRRIPQSNSYFLKPVFRPKIKKYSCKKAGDTIKSQRLWSCEIEHYTYYRTNPTATLYSKLPKGFTISNDGSLDSQEDRRGQRLNQGKEIQTCLFGGSRGENKIRDFLKRMREIKSYVDASCGLHIHIDATDIRQLPDIAQTNVLRKIIAFHILYEDVISFFLPANRRANRFARQLNQYFNYHDLKDCHSIEQFIEFWYKDNPDNVMTRLHRRYDSVRYYGINLHCYFSQNNIEVRHHSGTLNAQKVLEWVNLHTAIIDYCKDDTSTLAKIESDAIALHSQYLSDRAGLIRDMCKILGLSEDSVEYFQSRAKKFEKDDGLYEGDMSIPDSKKGLTNLNENENLCVA